MIIKGITMPNRSVFECYEFIPVLDEAWRLKDPAAVYDNYTYCVTADNELWENDIQAAVGIRPILIVNFDEKVEPETKVSLLGYNWTVLFSPGTTFLLCDEIIDYQRFDRNTNIFEKSELKVWLEEWLKNKRKEFNYG